MDGDDSSLISVITRDHRRLGDLLVRLTARGPARDGLVDEMTAEVMRHVVAEELYLYPLVREVVPEWVVGSAEHADIDARMERLLADLSVTRPDSPAFDALITRLVVVTRQAILHEELEVFPRLARHADRRLLTDLGTMFRAFSDAAVVERTCDAGRVIRFHGLVLHRWEPGLPICAAPHVSPRDVTPHLSLPA
ncbi:hemerythrin domain-containing protein [Actinoallomurus iriomotensis]|uniref:hemerythrin domain-containing protein n=1 Tax=Actinoallomurus TaxID=667113 RepID=UPI002555DC76|nr:hemerythrin domain-containing protein [Actinoallomurus iriomotensis]